MLCPHFVSLEALKFNRFMELSVFSSWRQKICCVSIIYIFSTILHTLGLVQPEQSFIAWLYYSVYIHNLCCKICIYVYLLGSMKMTFALVSILSASCHCSFTLSVQLIVGGILACLCNLTNIFNFNYFKYRDCSYHSYYC